MMKEIKDKLHNTLIYLGQYGSQYDELARKVIEISKPDRTRISALICDSKDIFFVIGRGEKEDWATLLSFFGLRYGKEFIDEVLAEYILRRDKELAVMYGNCQMHDYFDCLNMSSDFNRKYYSIYFKYQEYSRWKEDKFEIALKMCSLLICTNENFDSRYRNCREYVGKHNKGAFVISIPTYCYRGYFPQTNPFIQEKGEFDIVSEIFNSFHREDKIVNNLILNGYDIESIICQINSGRTITKEDIHRCNRISLMQIEAMDRISDVKIYDYFIENYKHLRLFKDPVHMENCLVWYVTMNILKSLGLRNDLDMPEKEIHYFTQLPIYPEVMETLGLEWSDHEMVKIRLKEGMIKVSVEEFLIRYFRFAKNALEIKSSLTINDNDNVAEWFPGYES